MVQPPHPTVLRGPYVVLAPTEPADAEELFVALDSAEVWQHLTTRRPGDAGQMRALVEQAVITRFPWTVRLTGSGEVAGWSSYLDVSVPDERLEIGWTAYGRPHWAGVVNPATKLLLMGHAFDDLGFGRVMLKTDARNVRSQEAIARLGAVREGVLRRYQRRADGSIRDTVVYSVLAEEWPAVRAGLQGRLAGYAVPGTQPWSQP